MEILNREAIVLFVKKHPLGRQPFSRWIDVTTAASWRSVLDVQRDFRSAEDVKGYVVFNIHGNDFRLITVIRYERKQVLVHEVFTHSEYNRWKP